VKLVQDALDRAPSGRTTIVIAHRLFTIRDANMIVVMNRGKIYETGQHAELIVRNGLYANLIQAQRLRTEKNNERAQEPSLFNNKAVLLMKIQLILTVTHDVERPVTQSVCNIKANGYSSI
jgi:ABC-type microcin C transport system duplicated ATPase subunit YejF